MSGGTEPWSASFCTWIMDITRKLLQLALQGAAGTSTGGRSYSVVSLLQENKLILVDNKEIKACNMEDVHLVTYGGTLHKGIIVDTGGKLSMENLLKVMQKYSATVEKIKVMNTATAATQTEIYLNKAAETQTEVAVSRSPPLICSDNNTFTVTDNIPLGEFIIGEGGQLEDIPHGSKMLSYGDEDVRGYEETRDTSLSMSSQFVATEASQSHSGYTYSPSGNYYCTDLVTLTESRKFIDGLSLFEEPEIFGMHENANIAFQCTNCGDKDSPKWRTGKGGKRLCNKCGIYWSRNNKDRPLGNFGVAQGTIVYSK